MNVLRKHKRDWFRILRDLMAADVSMGRVARYCGRDMKTVQAWANGSEPRDSDARVVMLLYRRHCRLEYDAHMAEFDPDMRTPEAQAALLSERAGIKVARRPVQRPHDDVQDDLFTPISKLESD